MITVHIHDTHDISKVGMPSGISADTKLVWVCGMVLSASCDQVRNADPYVVVQKWIGVDMRGPLFDNPFATLHHFAIFFIPEIDWM